MTGVCKQIANCDVQQQHTGRDRTRALIIAILTSSRAPPPWFYSAIAKHANRTQQRS